MSYISLPSPPGGLCDRCVHVQVVTTTRGSRFLLCQRARDDARFAKYPALPVLRCVGFEAVPSPPPSTGSR